MRIVTKLKEDYEEDFESGDDQGKELEEPENELPANEVEDILQVNVFITCDIQYYHTDHRLSIKRIVTSRQIRAHRTAILFNQQLHLLP